MRSLSSSGAASSAASIRSDSAILAEKFHGAQLASANAAYIMMYAVGMMIGPPALGLGLDLASPRGLFDALSVLFLAYLGLVLAFSGPARAIGGRGRA